MNENNYPVTAEQGLCAHCGSSNTRIERVEFDANMLVWLHCADCDGESIDCYEMASKGLVPKGEKR